MEPLPHDHIVPFKKSELDKKNQVSQMFDQIAGRYDFMNHFLSAGIDKSWRRMAIKKMKNQDPKIILDVASGTADMAIAACKILNPEKVIGIDISAQMLEVGRKKVEKEGFGQIVKLELGDSETINYAEKTFDAVTVAFGVRNFENLENGLKEMLRVLKPGGQLVILEFSKPKYMAVRSLYNLYMGILAPRVARWFRQNKDAYKYLCESANAFPDRRNFIDILKKAGFSETKYKSLSLGICCIYTGKKLGS